MTGEGRNESAALTVQTTFLEPARECSERALVHSRVRVLAAYRRRPARARIKIRRFFSFRRRLAPKIGSWRAQLRGRPRLRCQQSPALSARRSFSNVFQSFQSEKVSVGEDEIQRAKWCTSDRRVSYVGILELRQFSLRTTWFDGKLHLKFFLGILSRYFARIAREIVGQTLPGRAISSFAFSRLTVRPWTFLHFFPKARKCTELAWRVRT